jgi:hypothetical protein
MAAAQTVAEREAQHIAEREAQKKYWSEHSTEPTVEAMMLDSKASEIDRLERPEVWRCSWSSRSSSRQQQLSVLVQLRPAAASCMGRGTLSSAAAACMGTRCCC